jgi:hypothetical protein
VHFVTKVSLYFWNLHKILCLLIPMKSILWEKKILDPYIVHDPKSRDQWWRGHWVTKFIVAIFGTFGRYVTNVRVTLVENVKKVQNQATLITPVNFKMKIMKQKIAIQPSLQRYMYLFMKILQSRKKILSIFHNFHFKR